MLACNVSNKTGSRTTSVARSPSSRRSVRRFASVARGQNAE
jgi:hypothetical protein